MLQPLLRRQTRHPLLSSHICESTHPSTCEHHHDMLRCMAKGWHAWHRYQRRAARPKRASPRIATMIVACGFVSELSPAKRRRAQFFSGSIFLRAVFNADRLLPCCGPRCYSGLRAVRCRGTARAFAASKLHLSEKLRSAVGKVYLPVQRVPPATEFRIRMTRSARKHQKAALELLAPHSKNDRAGTNVTDHPSMS